MIDRTCDGATFQQHISSQNGEDLPEELKESQDRAEEVSAKMANSFMKLMKYMDDPEVMAAQERMGKIMMQQ